VYGEKVRLPNPLSEPNLWSELQRGISIEIHTQNMTKEDVWTQCGFSQEKFLEFLRIEDAEDAARCELSDQDRRRFSLVSFNDSNILPAAAWLDYWALMMITASMQETPSG